MPNVIKNAAIARRKYWVEEIRKLSGVFGDDYSRVESELATEIKTQGNSCLIDHLRLCGDIPESYDHDSTEEKLYSKYTDALLHESFLSLGLKSLVLAERADAADVEAFAKGFSFVADAKAFRLSRTAKNQKDFKIQAMDVWKRGKPYAMVVCPIYQLPARASQIYHQASARNVCIFTYSHLAVLSAYAQNPGKKPPQQLLQAIFESVKALNPSKDANAYWLAVNRTMLGFSKSIEPLWIQEKKAAEEALRIAKDAALTHLAAERERIMRMSHQAALKELLRAMKIEARIRTIEGVCDSGLMTIV